MPPPIIEFWDCRSPGVRMKTGTLGPPHKRVWAQFYKAALFELDASKVLDRIAEAANTGDTCTRTF